MPDIIEIYKMLDEYPIIVKEIVKANHDIHGFMTALNENCIRITANYDKILSMPKYKQASDPTYYAFQQTEKLNKTYQDKIGQTALYIINLVEKKTMIDSAMEKLTINERNILTMRCLERLPWEAVSDKLLYSERQCRRLKNIAMRKLMANMA